MTSEEIKKRKEELFGEFEPPTRSKMKAGFNKGLEFAQSKMYSEEEVKEIIKNFTNYYSFTEEGLEKEIKDFFETIKK